MQKGINRQVSVSPDLADFLAIKRCEKVSRPSVASFISKYVKQNNLVNPDDGRIFKADNKLKKILGEPRYLIKPKNPELGMGYSYLNLQSYLSPHFNNC